MLCYPTVTLLVCKRNGPLIFHFIEMSEQFESGCLEREGGIILRNGCECYNAIWHEDLP